MQGKASTQETSSNWRVFVGKREYTISQNQYDLVVEATQNDVKMLHFEKFSVSLPHISSMERIKKRKDTWTDDMEKISAEGMKRLPQSFNKLI